MSKLTRETSASVLEGIEHQHGTDAPHEHPDGDKNHKHGRGEYSQPEEE